jgi:hypothetical protein
MTINNDQTLLALQSKKCTFLKFSRILYNNSLSHNIESDGLRKTVIVLLFTSLMLTLQFLYDCGCVEAAFDGCRSSICVLFPLRLKHFICIFLQQLVILEQLNYKLYNMRRELFPLAVSNIKHIPAQEDQCF